MEQILAFILILILVTWLWMTVLGLLIVRNDEMFEISQKKAQIFLFYRVSTFSRKPFNSDVWLTYC